MDENQKIIQFVKNMRANGRSDEDIKNDLVQAGHQEQIINSAFTLCEQDTVTTDKSDSILTFDSYGNPIIKDTSTNRPAMSREELRAKRVHPRPAPRQRTTSKAASYQQTVDQLSKHRELESDSHHTLESGNADILDEQAVRPIEITQKQSELTENKPINNIEQLLEKQKDQSLSGPEPTNINQILSETEVSELNKYQQENRSNQPMIDLKNIPTISSIGRIEAISRAIQNSLAIKTFFILVGVLALIVVTHNVMLSLL